MINIIKTIKVNAAVSAINISNGEVQILDSSYLLNSYSIDDMSLIYKHLLSKEQDNRHTYDKSYALSGHLKIYLSIYHKNCGLLYTMRNNKLVDKDSLSFHENAVSFSTFSNNSNILAIGDEDGKSFFYDLNIKKAILSLNPRADSISCISFSKNDRFTSVCSYDKTMLIYDIDLNKEISEVLLSDVVEDCLFLQDSKTIVGVTRDKRLFEYDSKSSKITYGDFNFSEWPSRIIEIGDNYLLVGTRGKHIYLVDSDTLKIVKEVDTDNIGVKAMTMKDDKLFIGYINGRVEVINVNHLSKEFELNLKLDKFEEAANLIEDNIFLLINKEISKYDTVWPQVLDIAKSYLASNNDIAALKIAKPFFFDHKKELEYKLLTSNKEAFKHFIKLVEDTKDILAFKFADENEYLKDTKEYKEIDQKFNKVYQMCKQMFSKGDLESSQKAIDTLKRYTVISSKKDQVNNLITNYKHFIRAQTLVKAKNFKLYFILAMKKPFLAQEVLFEKVTQLGHQTYLKLLKLEQNDEFEQAKPIAKYLQDFTGFKDKATEQLESIKSKEDIKNYIDADDREAVYSTVSNNNNLESYKLFITYHEVYNDNKQVALMSAKDGHTMDVHNKLHTYFFINYLENSISSVFKLSYISEMENAAKEDFSSINWIETVKRYVSIYDWDNEILLLVKEIKIKDMLLNYNSKIEKSTLNKIEFFDSILVYS